MNEFSILDTICILLKDSMRLFTEVVPISEGIGMMIVWLLFCMFLGVSFATIYNIFMMLKKENR